MLNEILERQMARVHALSHEVFAFIYISCKPTPCVRINNYFVVMV